MRIYESRLTCITKKRGGLVRGGYQGLHRVLTVLDIGITEPEMLIDETGGNDAERCLVENQMASDFSGLSARPLKQNQWCN